MKPLIYDQYGKPVGFKGDGRKTYNMPGDVPEDVACTRCGGEGRVAVVVRMDEVGESIVERKVVGGYTKYFNHMLERADDRDGFLSPEFIQEECRACAGSGYRNVTGLRG